MPADPADVVLDAASAVVLGGARLRTIPSVPLLLFSKHQYNKE